MTFTHKLSCRLALMRDRIVVVPAVLVAAAVVFACQMPVRVTGPNGSILSQLGVAPIAVTLHQNQVVSFMAVALTTAGDTDVAPVAIAWSVTGGTIVDTSSSGGRHYGHYQAAASPGVYSVVAAAQPSGLADTATVTVIPVPVASVSVSPPSASVLVGGTVSLTATTLDSAGSVLTGRAITWSSNSTAVATVNGSGVLSAVAPGSTTITATSEGKSGTASVTVSSVPVASVTVAPASASLQVGQTVQLTATPKDASGNPLAGRVVTWASSNTAMATVSSSGLVTGVAAGSATITATSEGQSGTATVTVIFVPVASVTVTPASATLGIGQTVQLTATPKDASGNPLSGRVITWASSNTAVATVSGTGLVTAIGAGSATVTATAEGQSGSSSITAIIVPVASVSVAPATATVQVGLTVLLTATPKDASGNPLAGRVITWASSNTAVAAVSASGLVTGVAVGSVTITATSEGKSGTATVTVVASAPSAGCAPTGSGVCRYVDAALGNDANPGDSAQPFQTIQQAAAVVNPGDWVVVRNGVYTGGTTVLTAGRGGTATNYVVFAAQHRGGAVIDGQNNTSDIAVRINGNYVRIQGFEVRNTVHGIQLATSAHDVQIAQNNIHDIGRTCTTTTNGQSGIYSESNNLLVEQNVIYNIGRLGEGERGCTYGGNNVWVNHDHGIYLKGSNIIIRNNVFYNNARGWSIQMYGATVDQVSIVNNTFAFPNPYKSGQIIVAEPMSNSIIANNIFYQPLNGGIEFDAADGGSASNVTVANNITSSGPVSTGFTTGVTFSSNLDNTDPLLVNPLAFDFHLQASSPAIGAGLGLSYVPNDFDGVSRPLGAPYDIGAYQFK
jgi:parallel beta-helix repeat protein